MIKWLKKIFGFESASSPSKSLEKPKKLEKRIETKVTSESEKTMQVQQPEIGQWSPEFNHLEFLVRQRMHDYFNIKNEKSIPQCPPMDQWHLSASDFFSLTKISDKERILLLIAICPHVYGNLFDQVIQENLPKAGDFPQLGGTRGKDFRGFLPTGETALFLLAGDDQEKRKVIQSLFDPDSFFPKNRILWLQDVREGEPRMSGRIIMSQEYVDLLTRGKLSRPAFSLRFPAQQVETAFEWDDLVLNQETMAQIRELRVWLKHGKTLLDRWEMRKKLKPGYRVLFHGPPGTGKTLTASLLGKYTKRDVYKIDLSMLVSKFIGETEKNLANLFAKAENKDWILFFDEADALFGKRTNVRDAHDKYANQEVSYLLQRIEDYNGLVILASNFKTNIDDAFVRRFQSIIHFPVPSSSEREKIWKKAFPKNIVIADDLNLGIVAGKFELTGAEIMNVVQFCCLRALDCGNHHISGQDVTDGIKKEYRKEGKIMR